MPKSNPLDEGLKHQVQRQRRPKTAKSASAPVTRTVPPSRNGRVLLAGHVPLAAATEFKMIAVSEHTTVQALLQEAMNMIFASRGKPEIAGISPTVKEGN
jgi:hypothetical protein